MDADQDTASEPLDRIPSQPSVQHPAGHEDEVLLDSPEQAALLAEMEGDDDGTDGAPWTDGPDRVGEGDLPEPLPSSTKDTENIENVQDEVLPMSVEGVGDLVADPLSRAKVVPRDDPGGPAPDEVPPSPS